MAKLTKRMKAIAEKVDAEKIYPIEEAVTLLTELSKTKLKESIDIAVNGNGSIPQVLCGFNHAAGNLTSVGNQNL